MLKGRPPGRMYELLVRPSNFQLRQNNPADLEKTMVECHEMMTIMLKGMKRMLTLISDEDSTILKVTLSGVLDPLLPPSVWDVYVPPKGKVIVSWMMGGRPVNVEALKAQDSHGLLQRADSMMRSTRAVVSEGKYRRRTGR